MLWIEKGKIMYWNSGIIYLVRLNWISNKICLNLFWNNNWFYEWWVFDYVKVY